MSSPILHTFIADLLHNLEQEGITLGTGRYLKVQELWRRLPDDIEPERLKTLLVPLFATNPQEQERFYAIFDKSWRRVQELNKIEEVKPEPPMEEEVAEQNWRWLLYVAAVLFLGALAWILFRTNTAFQPINNFPRSSAQYLSGRYARSGPYFAQRGDGYPEANRFFRW
jgi:hypothetical protein